MKTYNKPEILIENINIEDVIMVSLQGIFDDWNNENNQTPFEDLWGE